MATSLVKEAAKELVSSGVSVIPVAATTKLSIGLWMEFQKRYATWEEIDAWPDNCRMAVVYGKISGLTCVDLDLASGGIEWYRETFGDKMPPTRVYKTPGGGRHLIFKYVPGLKNRVGKQTGVDIRNDGGYALVPPSEGYEILQDQEPCAIPPELLVALLPKEFSRSDGRADRKWEEAFDPAPIGSRNTAAASLAGRLLQRLPAEDWLVAWQALRSWNADNQEPLSEKELRTTFDSIAKAEAAGRIGSSPHTLAEYIRPMSALRFQSEEDRAKTRIVPGLLVQGLNLLWGKPKAGKSLLAQQLIHAVSTGKTPFELRLSNVVSPLGDGEVRQGSVLWLSVDDNESRIAKRQQEMFPKESFPDNVWVATSWENLDKDSPGLRLMEEWLEGTPDARLIVVDLWRSIRGTGDLMKGRDDYQDLHPLKQLADTYGVAVLVVHHQRKQSATDVGDTISGTLGMTGAADLLLNLEKQPENSRLFVQGRDYEDCIYSVKLEYPKWEFYGIESAARLLSKKPSLKQKVMEYLMEHPEGKTNAEIAQALEESVKRVYSALIALRNTGRVQYDNKLNRPKKSETEGS